MTVEFESSDEEGGDGGEAGEAGTMADEEEKDEDEDDADTRPKKKRRKGRKKQQDFGVSRGLDFQVTAPCSLYTTPQPPPPARPRPLVLPRRTPFTKPRCPRRTWAPSSMSTFPRRSRVTFTGPAAQLAVESLARSAPTPFITTLPFLPSTPPHTPPTHTHAHTS